MRSIGSWVQFDDNADFVDNCWNQFDWSYRQSKKFVGIAVDALTLGLVPYQIRQCSGSSGNPFQKDVCIVLLSRTASVVTMMFWDVLWFLWMEEELFSLTWE